MANEDVPMVSKEVAAEVAKLVGLDVSPDELAALLPLIEAQFRQSQRLRDLKVDSAVEPDQVFLPQDGE